MASVSKEVGAAISLPDNILVRIFEKTDLKTLFNCKRVCRRFYQIACEVNTITFVAPSRRWRANNPEFREHVRLLAVYQRKFSGGKFGWMFSRLVGGLINSMTKFTRLKSLYIELPLSSFNGYPIPKWKVFIDSNRIDSFVLLASTSIHNTKGSSYVDDHEEEELSYYMSPIGSYTAEKCMENAFVRYLMLFVLARECPFLEKISITDSRKRGRICLSGAKLCEVRKSFTSIAPPDEVDKFISKFQQRMSSRGVRGCDIPFLYLRNSGLVMKDVKLTLYSYEEGAAYADEEDSEEEATYSDFEEQNNIPYEYEYGYEEAAFGELEQNDLPYEYEYTSSYEEATYGEENLPHGSYSDSDEEDNFEDSEEEATYSDFQEQNDLLPYEYEYSYDGYINIDEDFEDKEEAAFSEALMEIFNKHSHRIRR